MTRTRARRPALAALLVAIVAAAPARADFITYSGTTVGGPTWNRPIANGTNPPGPPLSGVGTDVPYSVQPFYVTGTESYNFLSLGTDPPNWDNYTFLYRGAFDPAAPLTNALGGNDDFPTMGRSGFNDVALTADVQYSFVTTGYGNGDAGAFTNTISTSDADSPGRIILGQVQAVPEPASLVLATSGGALVGLGLAWRRRRSAA